MTCSFLTEKFFTTGVLPQPRTGFAGVATPKPERVDAATQAAEPKAGATIAESAATTAAATAAAVRRAAHAEAALATALEEAEELESRCALAQARESEAKREANERVNELARELEEANDHGPQVTMVGYGLAAFRWSTIIHHPLRKPRL